MLTQVQIKSLYHELQTDKLSASVAEMSEFFRSSKTKNTSAEVSEIETGSGTKRSAEENYHYRRLSLESPDKVARRSLESVATQQTTLNQAPLIRFPTIASVILTKWRPQFLTSQLTLAQR